jgi:hypothetical protein
MDPYILTAAGALAMSNVALAFLEPTIAMWMQGVMNASQWEIGLVWLPSFLPYLKNMATLSHVNPIDWTICPAAIGPNAYAMEYEMSAIAYTLPYTDLHGLMLPYFSAIYFMLHYYLILGNFMNINHLPTNVMF